MDEKKRVEWSNIDLYCIIKFVLRHSWMVVLSMLICVMLVYLLQSLAFAPEYTSSVTFSVTSRSASSASVGNIAVTDTVAGQFGELLSSDIVRSSAAERMGLDSFPAEIEIYVPEATNIVRMSVTAASPELAYKSSLAVIDCHSEYSKTVFITAVLDTINGPTISVVPSSLSGRQKVLTLSAPAGALLMIFLLIFMSIQADTIQTPHGAKQQLEGKLLATVYHERKRRTLRSLFHREKTSLLISTPLCSFYYTETIHQFRVNIEHAKEHHGHKVFMICSCSENEGKSTIAANIALSLAQKHEKVLLVDADLRRPSQALIFERPTKRGVDFGAFIGKTFKKEALMESVTYTGPQTNLHILYSSPLSRHKLESLSAASFQPMFDTLREEFSYIIVDTPPIGLFADAEVLADVVDASVLVVRQDTVSAIMINDAIDNLSDANSTFLGYVLNNFRTFRTTALLHNHYGYGYGYGYGHGYGYGYGYGKSKATEKHSKKRKE